MQNPESNPMTLTRYIIENQRKHAPHATGDLSTLLTSIQLTCKSISNSCNKAGIYNLYGTTGEINCSEDRVKKLDILANEMMINSLTFTGQVALMASEENEEIIEVPTSVRGKYCVVFDPLDGSSNIDANISVGTIFGIYRCKQGKDKVSLEDLLQPGRNLVAAGYCMYGAATILVFSTGYGVNGFTLDNTMGEFILTHPSITIPNPSKQIYSVNEGNSANWDKAISTFVEECHHPSDAKPWSHRYVGSMVSDVHRTLNYGGIFLYPADKKSPSGKLRLVYEGNPMAFLIDQAGGKSSTGRENLLDLKPTKIHQRVPVVMGTKCMVDKVELLYEKLCK